MRPKKNTKHSFSVKKKQLSISKTISKPWRILSLVNSKKALEHKNKLQVLKLKTILKTATSTKLQETWKAQELGMINSKEKLSLSRTKCLRIRTTKRSSKGRFITWKTSWDTKKRKSTNKESRSKYWRRRAWPWWTEPDISTTRLTASPCRLKRPASSWMRPRGKLVTCTAALAASTSQLMNQSDLTTDSWTTRRSFWGRRMARSSGARTWARP